MQPELLEQNDAELIETVLSELADIFGVRGEPDFVRVLLRYPKAMRRSTTWATRTAFAQIDSNIAQHRGLALAGNAYRGVGLPRRDHQRRTSGGSRFATIVRNSVESKYE